LQQGSGGRGGDGNGGSNGSIGGASLDSLRQESVLPGPEPGKMIATRQRAESDLSVGNFPSHCDECRIHLYLAL
jgi:hypothetical protein